MLWFCTFRRFLGFVTWPTLSFLNGFATCLVTVWIETKQRRALLLPYLLNLGCC
uniref:Uncharacterized protein n=1 Tax=Meloidogyne incognita TaxID=6306 RepID=A0A914LCU2_MELIC